MGRTHEDLGAARADLHDIKNPNVDRVQANFHYSLQTWAEQVRSGSWSRFSLRLSKWKSEHLKSPNMQGVGVVWCTRHSSILKRQHPVHLLGGLLLRATITRGLPVSRRGYCGYSGRRRLWLWLYTRP